MLAMQGSVDSAELVLKFHGGAYGVHRTDAGGVGPTQVGTFTYNMLVPFPEVPELEQAEAQKFLPPPMTFKTPAAAAAGTPPVIVQTR